MSRVCNKRGLLDIDPRGVKSNRMSVGGGPFSAEERRAVKMRERAVRCGNNQQQNVIAAFHKKSQTDRVGKVSGNKWKSAYDGNRGKLEKLHLIYTNMG